MLIAHSTLRSTLLACLILTGLSLTVGCEPGRKVYREETRPVIDRKGVDFPAGLELSVAAKGFHAAAAVATDEERNHVYIGDQSIRGEEIRITRLDPATGEMAEIYPARRAIVSWFDGRPRLKASIGGMLLHEGELYVSARDEEGFGIIVAFDLRDWTPEDGRPQQRTVVGELPARGDHGVTDLAIHPLTGRLFFGVGSATNSGVVGLDNYRSGWLRRFRDFHDRPLVALKIFGYRFDTEDPFTGLLYPNKVNTAPFNAFGNSSQRVAPADNNKPTAAVYSVEPTGGDLRVEAHGLRYPTGLAFNDFATLYASNQGMELRGTRPVRDDPDAIVRVLAADSTEAATWYGWPDYSTDLRPITLKTFQPPEQYLARTGYKELSFLIDHDASGPNGLVEPDREALLSAVFPPLSGASGIDFIPNDVPEAFTDVAGKLVVALRGDRAPFATSGLPLKKPLGRKVAVADVDSGTWQPLVYNTGPDTDASPVLLRPSDVTFGLGGLWILDYGDFDMDDGREDVEAGSGRLLFLSPSNREPATRPDL